MNFRFVKVLKCFYPNIDQIFENALIQLRLCGYPNAHLETHMYLDENDLRYEYIINLKNNFNGIFLINLYPRERKANMFVRQPHELICIENEHQIQDTLNEIILQL
jgi:hypothetical protein